MTDFSQVTRDLVAMRNKYGAQSQIGGRCSNIIEQIDNLPPPPEEWVEYMMPAWVPEIWDRLRGLIWKQMTELRELVRDAQ